MSGEEAEGSQSDEDDGRDVLSEGSLVLPEENILGTQSIDVDADLEGDFK